LTDSKRFSRLLPASPPEVLACGGFLTLTRQSVRNQYEDGSQSRAYAVETAQPRFLDAVLLLYTHSGPSAAEVRVVLRRGVRPVVALRSETPGLAAQDQEPFSGAFWELPAGGIEPPDLAPQGPGLAGRASQEAWEEAGLRVAPGEFFSLGPAPFFAPAFCPERLHYLAAEVDPAQAAPPPGDGHPMEEGAEARFLPLDEALSWCARGVILDGKSELGLRRLRQWLDSQGQRHDRPFPGLPQQA
jgi:ADP-ribose pyrophosphatase